MAESAAQFSVGFRKHLDQPFANVLFDSFYGTCEVVDCDGSLPVIEDLSEKGAWLGEIVFGVPWFHSGD